MWSSRPYDEEAPFIWWPTPVRSVEESVTQPTLDGSTPKSMGNHPVFAQSGERGEGPGAAVRRSGSWPRSDPGPSSALLPLPGAAVREPPADRSVDVVVVEQVEVVGARDVQDVCAGEHLRPTACPADRRRVADQKVSGHLAHRVPARAGDCAGDQVVASVRQVAYVVRQTGAEVDYPHRAVVEEPAERRRLGQ